MYCHPLGVRGLGLEFMGLFAMASLVYVGGGSAYGVRVLGRPKAFPCAHPHAERWAVVAGLVSDGIGFARGGGAATEGRRERLLGSTGESWVSRREPAARAAERSSPKGGGKKAANKATKKTAKKVAASSGSGGEPLAAARAGPATATKATAAGGGGSWVHVPT
jgi:hypothetical protein